MFSQIKTASSCHAESHRQVTAPSSGVLAKALPSASATETTTSRYATSWQNSPFPDEPGAETCEEPVSVRRMFRRAGPDQPVFAQGKPPSLRKREATSDCGQNHEPDEPMPPQSRCGRRRNASPGSLRPADRICNQRGPSEEWTTLPAGTRAVEPSE